MKDFESKVVRATKELSAKEKIMLKDTTNAVKLDEATTNGAVEIDYDFHAEISVHNERAPGANKDYTKYVIVDKSGQKYVTGSPSFIRALDDIIDEMTDAGETEIKISCYRVDSKNYAGKQFLTCSII